MRKGVLTWVGLLMGLVGTAGFFYGLVVLISNGNCGCSDPNYACAAPPCPPQDDLGFLGLFAGIWIAVIGFIILGVGRSRSRVQQWRAQLGSGATGFQGSRLATATGYPVGTGVTLASMGGAFGAGSGATPTAGGVPGTVDMQGMSQLAGELQQVRQQHAGDPAAARQATLDVLRSHGYPIPADAGSGPVAIQMSAPAVDPSGPGFALPGALPAAPAPMSAEAILARDAQSGIPTAQPSPGDATGRLQELEALKQQGVLTDDEYAAQRKRILDSI
jgi:hypothetical protein